jgi:pimeloyl-ACP methyl ester carboxylesterase
MADHLRVLEREGTSMGALIPPPQIPVVVISSGNQPPEQIAAHRMLAEQSAHGHHVVAERSAHWVQFDDPELVVALVRKLVEGGRDMPLPD